jgi:hypothetical protein
VPYRITWEPAGAYVKFFGVVTTEDMASLYAELARDARSDWMRYVLADYLGATRSTNMSLSDVKGIAALEKGASFGNPDVWNAVVATDASIREYVQFFTSLDISPYPLRIFPTVEEARAWLAARARLRSAS